jgi:hypothetical protein
MQANREHRFASGIGRRMLLLGLAAAASGCGGQSAQRPDPDFNPPIGKATFREGQGPVVAIDEAHYNFHTAGGRYSPFARLLRRDGYRVLEAKKALSAGSLKDVHILVISNALAERNAKDDWTLPTPPAFTAAEAIALREWVEAGASLLLIADHMPFPGAVSNLAREFGVTFSNGFAVRKGVKDGRLFFRREDGGLRDNKMTRGISTVVSFTGSAFRAIDADPLLVLGADVESLEPDQAWRFEEKTPRVPVAGWYQGAVMSRGKGRVAVFGEAAMFSAQLDGVLRSPMGMNHPAAAENPRFLLNVMRWLAGVE